MLNKIVGYLIRNKLVPFILLIFMLGWGISTAPFDWELGFLSENKVAVDAIPDIGENQQIVFTEWPGRSPQDIEDQITYPLTTALLGIPGVKTIRSTSMFGFSSIYIIFEENVDFYWSRSRILEKLNSLPKGLLPEGVQPALGPDATGLGQIFWYTIEGRDSLGHPTGGWSLEELRSVQDFYVKYALSSAEGVSEVASIGGFVKEYQVQLDPLKMKQYDVSLADVVKAVRNSNQEIGAKTVEINRVEYFVRGLGYIKSLADLENTVVKTIGRSPVYLKDVAFVTLGPAERRGILDKEGNEVVGGVVVARYGANPMKVIENVKEKIAEISSGLPEKKLADGKISKLTVVPFYDRTKLIKETLHTLNEALYLQILITILVILIMIFNLRASFLISSLLPLAVLMVFISMKIFNVPANIVALSGIAIAIGTMVDIGVILTENIIRHLNENKGSKSIDKIVFEASSEVSGAILTAVMTTIISFIPVFTMTGAEGKLFRPLAFTKTMALVASIFVALFLIPPFAAIIFRKTKTKERLQIFSQIFLIALGVLGIFFGYYVTLLLILLGVFNLLIRKQIINISPRAIKIVHLSLFVLAVLWLLAQRWKPLGWDESLIINLIFIAAVSLGLLAFFSVFQKYYVRLLQWALKHKKLFLSIPLSIFILGIFSMRSLEKEFMPALDEGAFLLMPTSMAHAGISENRRILQLLDYAVSKIPEVESVVGKAGRVESALDPAPLSMFENVINYKTEYVQTEEGVPVLFETNSDGYFLTKKGELIADGKFDPEELPENVIYFNDYPDYKEQLIPDRLGSTFRQWRKHIKTKDDIWDEIVSATKIPGVTSAPKLQPIQTRLIMLQTGMRAPMGIKVKGPDLKTIEEFGYELEKVLKEVPGVKKEAVFADRIVGKPYLLIKPDRKKLARYGLNIGNVHEMLTVALAGKKVSQSVEGRERYAIVLRYPRELRMEPFEIENILLDLKTGEKIPLKEVAQVTYESGPQVIKSEDTFLTGYVLFDKEGKESEMTVVERARDSIEAYVKSGRLKIPDGVSYKFTGTYENQIRAEKTLSIVIPVTLLIIFLILYFQFKRISTTLMVFTGIAIAFSGGFILIWLYGQPWFMNVDLFGYNFREVFNIHTVNLSVAVWVGFIALFGIATDDGVVIATYLTQTFEKNQPKTIESIRKSVIEAGKKRIRPCLMTTATTILALLPVLTSTGRGSDIMIPMAIPSVGGMMIALITLFVVPVLFSMQAEAKIKKNNN